MKKTKPILGANYRPSWTQEPNYLAKKFKAIQRRIEEERKEAQSKIINVRQINRSR